MIEEGLTPAMKQYFELKNEVQDAVLFFRMWDFYEMFWEDAHIAHTVLWVALTTRNKNAKEPIPLAWIPFHAKEKYLPKLVQAGYKVAIAEQVSDPKLKWIVKRAIVRVVTPGTLHIESDSQESSVSNIILAITEESWAYGMSYIDTSSNSWISAFFQDFSMLSREIYKISPLEVVLEKKLFQNQEIHDLLSKKYGLNIYYYEIKHKPKEFLMGHFWVKNLEWFWIENFPLAQSASALVLEYLQSVHKHQLEYMNSLKFETFSYSLDLDESTIRSLDLVYNFFTKSSREGTLLWVLNHTKTAMWMRLLRENIIHPLQDVSLIHQRYDFIEAFLKDKPLLDDISTELKKIADIDTLLSRIALWRANPRDLLMLKKSLKALVSVFKLIESSKNIELKKILSIES